VPAEPESAKTESERPLIDLCDDKAETAAADPETGSGRDEPEAEAAKSAELIRLKPLQLCIVKIQSLLKVRDRCYDF
jgi:hypothetical protein